MLKPQKDRKNLAENFKILAKENKLSHAYLFFGGGEEKFIFAESLANFLENGVFKPSKSIFKETMIVFPDEEIRESIGIDAVRGLKHFLWQRPIFSKYRMIIVKGAENFTVEAQHAILKIIEEPPENSLIILICSGENDLLSTVVSRCQKIYFSDFSRSRVSAVKTKSAGAGGETEDIDGFFRSAIADLSKDKIKNVSKLKEAFKRLTLIKRFNVNKRLQLAAFRSYTAEYGNQKRRK